MFVFTENVPHASEIQYVSMLGHTLVFLFSVGACVCVYAFFSSFNWLGKLLNEIACKMNFVSVTQHTIHLVHSMKKNAKKIKKTKNKMKD